MAERRLWSLESEDDENAGAVGNDIHAQGGGAVDRGRTFGGGLHPKQLDASFVRFFDDGFCDVGRSDDGNTLDGFWKGRQTLIGREALYFRSCRVDGEDSSVVLEVAPQYFVAVLSAVS